MIPTKQNRIQNAVLSRKGGKGRVFFPLSGVPWWALSFLLLFFFNPSSFGQDGQKLFKSNCASCHDPGTKDLVGPGLEGVTERRDMDWLLEWTKSSQDMIDAGDEEAVAVFEEYNEQVMPDQALSDDEIKAIYDFIESGGEATGGETASNGEGGGKEKRQAPMHISTKMTLYWLALMALVVIVPAILAVDRALKVIKADKGEWTT